jgi:general secretion pathway protein J
MFYNNKTDSGFTLLELLIAITVFATMSVMAYGGLRNVIDNSGASEQALQRMKAVQTTITTIGRDVTQLLKRDIRDEYGNRQNYLLTGHNLDLLVEFTRGGRRNPAGLLRSTMLRVAYQLEDDKLTRMYWSQLDRAPGIAPYKTELIDKVESVEFRFMQDAGSWHNQWPPLNASTTAGASAAKLRAVEVTVELQDWGKITRLYEVSL